VTDQANQGVDASGRTRRDVWHQPPRGRVMEAIDQTSPRRSGPVPLPAGLGQREEPRFSIIWVAAIALCTVLGLACVAVADTAAQRGENYGRAVTFFMIGLVVIFAPIAFRVLAKGVNRQERLVLVILLGLALYAVKILGSPDSFTFRDEYIHLRNTQDILRTHHLFGLNPLLPTAAYYPGLAALTAGLVDLTGLSPFVSGLLVIAVARVLVSACFFLAAERITGSSLVGAGAGLIYAANPMFLLWSSNFTYEDLGLPLAALAVWWLARTRREAGRLVPVVTLIVIAAVTVTHHVAGFALAAMLCAWWLAERLLDRPAARARRHSVGLMALVAGSASLMWFFFVARPAASYLLDQNILPPLHQMSSLLLGHGKARPLYSGGPTVPKWYKLANFGAVGLLILALPFGIYRAWNIFFGTREAGHRRFNVPMLIAMIVAAAYPVSLLPRLTAEGGALSARSAEFVFTGLGCVLALLAEESARSRRKKSRARRPALVARLRTPAAACIVTAIFIGNVSLGSTYSELLPEPSHPTGYPQILQPDAITASTWALKHLGANQPFAVDAVNARALATSGDQNTLGGKSVWPIFLSGTMNKAVVNAIRTAGVRYLFVDWRMTEGIPTGSTGYYFSPYEPNVGHYTHPIPVSDLQKFAIAGCSQLIYHSGPIQILNVTRIENGSCVPQIVQPDVITASTWARKHLGANQPFAANAADARALATFGDEKTLDGKSVQPVFVSGTMNRAVVHAIRTTRVRYLFVDWRTAEGIPPKSTGNYFGSWVPSADNYTHPIPVSELQKFAADGCSRLIYHSGPIQIFDVTRIENGSCVPRTAKGTRRGSASR
jgi:hypothetical protein